MVNKENNQTIGLSRMPKINSYTCTRLTSP